MSDDKQNEVGMTPTELLLTHEYSIKSMIADMRKHTRNGVYADPRLLSVGITQIELGFLALHKALP